MKYDAIIGENNQSVKTFFTYETTVTQAKEWLLSSPKALTLRRKQISTRLHA
jgi:hypothetical protein